MGAADRIAVVKASVHVGRLVREWRTARGLSQLALAEDAGFSSRHVSFIETGRTQPSRQSLLVLAETLDMPLRDRNRLLEAGGYARMFSETPLEAAEMTRIRSVLQFVLDRHLPNAALVLDRYANCLMGNAASGRLLARLVDPALMTPGANMLRVIFHPQGVRRWIVNWPHVGRYLLDRAERDFGGSAADDAGAQLLRELRGCADLPEAADAPARGGASDVLLPVHIRRGDLELRLVTTIMTFGTPQDVTLQELRLESFFPADEESERRWAAVMSEG